MERFIRFLFHVGKGLWSLLTRGLKIAFGWIAEGFLHFIAGGAVSGANRVLDSARDQAKEMGVRGSSAAIGYSGGSASGTSSTGRKPDAKNFMGQFI